MRAKDDRAHHEYMNQERFIRDQTPINPIQIYRNIATCCSSAHHSDGVLCLPLCLIDPKVRSVIAGMTKLPLSDQWCFATKTSGPTNSPELRLDVRKYRLPTERRWWYWFRYSKVLVRCIFKLIDVSLPEQWPRMTYAEALRRYGSDKPDLRFEMELVDLTDEMRGTDFAPFASAIEANGEIKSIVVHGRADYSRKQLDELQEFAKRYGAGALAYKLAP